MSGGSRNSSGSTAYQTVCRAEEGRLLGLYSYRYQCIIRPCPEDTDGLDVNYVTSVFGLFPAEKCLETEKGNIISLTHSSPEKGGISGRSD